MIELLLFILLITRLTLAQNYYCSRGDSEDISCAEYEGCVWLPQSSSATGNMGSCVTDCELGDSEDIACAEYEGCVWVPQSSNATGNMGSCVWDGDTEASTEADGDDSISWEDDSISWADDSISWEDDEDWWNRVGFILLFISSFLPLKLLMLLIGLPGAALNGALGTSCCKKSNPNCCCDVGCWLIFNLVCACLSGLADVIGIIMLIAEDALYGWWICWLLLAFTTMVHVLLYSSLSHVKMIHPEAFQNATQEPIEAVPVQFGQPTSTYCTYCGGNRPNLLCIRFIFLQIYFVYIKKLLYICGH